MLPLFQSIKFSDDMQDSFAGQDLGCSMGSLDEISDLSNSNADCTSEKSSKIGSEKSGSSGSRKSVVFQRKLDTTMDRVFKTGIEKV